MKEPCPAQSQGFFFFGLNHVSGLTMSRELKVTVGQHSDRGRKESNQDFHGILVSEAPLLQSKGIAIALADGISSSKVSGIASESAVKAFLLDYFCTSETWSVKTSAYRVLAATNSWLHSQTGRSQHPHDKDKGYVCTFSAIILKSTTAHIFHIGDSRVYRKLGYSLEQLTEDHRVILSPEQSYLSRALGINPQVEIDYRAIPVEKGDIFLLATDGVYEHVDARFITRVVTEQAADLQAAAKFIADEAFNRGSEDNLTLQIIRIDDLPAGNANEVLTQASELPLPPLLEARTEFDGYRIIREIHASSRSHIYLATDITDNTPVVLKIPSIDLREDPSYLKRFRMEEWVARRINSPHVLKPCLQTRPRNFLYLVTEFIDGQTLTQWMIDNPKPDLEIVRNIIEQIARGLQAFHRMEMLHQDIRPENIMIDKTGTVKIIDFGSTRVAGVLESEPSFEGNLALGTAQYMAPEYFLGKSGTQSSDIFSLGVITYQMLAGQLPYGAELARARTSAQQKKLKYRTVLKDSQAIPLWIDGALRKAVHTDPYKRYDELSEFIYDLRHPNASFKGSGHSPLLERNPLLFWKLLSFMLACIVIILLAYGRW